MEAIPQQIYDTARNTAAHTRAFRNPTILSIFNRQDSLENVVDLLESHKNLTVALGARSIKYSDNDLEAALEIAKTNVMLAKEKYDELDISIVINPIRKLISDRPFIIVAMYCLCIFLLRLIFKSLHIDDIYTLIPSGILLVVIMYYYKSPELERLRKTYNLELNTEYLIDMLLNQKYRNDK